MSDVIGHSTIHEPFYMERSREVKKSVETRKIDALEQEIIDETALLKLERNKYVHYKIVREVLEEFINEENSQESLLRTKVKDILLNASIAQVTALDEDNNPSSTSSIFGLCDIDSPALTYLESKSLQDIIKTKLNKRYECITEDFHNVKNMNIIKLFHTEEHESPSELSNEEKELVEYKNQLLAEQEKYVKNLISLSELLQEIAHSKVKEVPEIVDDKVKECQVNKKINNLKSLLAQQKCRVDVFTETSCSLKAYKELIEDIKQQQQEYQKEIEHLTEMQTKYKKVSCKQYDEILETYRQYKISIEKLKIQCEGLEN